jgi:mRNA interferase MazF
MAVFAKGEIVVFPFPYSDLSKSKNRPAYVASVLKNNELILCQITSSIKSDKYSIIILNEDLDKGKLHFASAIKPNRIFTADCSIIIKKIGKLNIKKITEIQNKIIELFLN